MARPSLDISPAQIRKLAAGMHTHAGIAARLGISHDTLQRRLENPEFKAAYEEGRELACAEVRDLQMEAARKLNPTVLIWLGKQYLGQKDTVETQLTGADGGPLELRVIYREPRTISIDVEPPPRQIASPSGHAD